MALPLRRSLQSSFRWHTNPCYIQLQQSQRLIPQARRQFTSGRTQCAQQVVRMQRRKTEPIQDMSTLKMEAIMDQEAIQTDFGLLPGVFIPPTAKNKPSWFRQPGARLKLLRTRVWTFLQDMGGNLVYKVYTIKPRPKLFVTREALDAAKRLHTEMYTAFANRDENTLGRICSDGILQSLRVRIGSRAPTERWTWKLLEYTHKPKVVSSRATLIPFPGIPKETPCAIRQVVVRIRSRQNLTRYGKLGARLPPGRAASPDVVERTGEKILDDKVMDTDEYFVIQKIMWMGTEKPWQVWGTTHETTIEEIEQRERDAAGLEEEKDSAGA